MSRDDMIADIEHVGIVTEPVEPLTVRQIVGLVALGAAVALGHLLLVGGCARG